MLNEQLAVLGIKDSAKSSDAIMLRQAIISEYDAISLYEQMAASTRNKKLKKLMLDVAKEEKVHVGEFEALLSQIDKEHEPAVADGRSEAASLIGSKRQDFKEWMESIQPLVK